MTAKSIKDLTVIIPAYNERQRIETTLQKVIFYLREHGYTFEVLVIDDGSTDGTRETVSSLSDACPELKLHCHESNQGKGQAVKTGISKAGRSFCLLMDADNSTDIAELGKMAEKVEQGYSVVVASRHLPGSKIVHPQPLVRRCLGAGYRSLCRTLFGINGSDFNCGFKVYETAIAKTVFAKARMKDWTFDIEIFCFLKEAGVSVAEVPVQWLHCEKPSNLKPFQAAFSSLLSLTQIKKNLMRSHEPR